MEHDTRQFVLDLLDARTRLARILPGIDSNRRFAMAAGIDHTWISRARTGATKHPRTSSDRKERIMNEFIRGLLSAGETHGQPLTRRELLGGAVMVAGVRFDVPALMRSGGLTVPPPSEPDSWQRQMEAGHRAYNGGNLDLAREAFAGAAAIARDTRNHAATALSLAYQAEASVTQRRYDEINPLTSAVLAELGVADLPPGALTNPPDLESRLATSDLGLEAYLLVARVSAVLAHSLGRFEAAYVAATGGIAAWELAHGRGTSQPLADLYHSRARAGIELAAKRPRSLNEGGWHWRSARTELRRADLHAGRQRGPRSTGPDP